MFYKINWIENKNKDWKVASIVDPEGKEVTGVSINRTNKNGETFPNFDEIKPGSEVGGEFWTSSAGKHYLFAPKQPHKRTFTPKTGNIAAAQEKKAEMIETAQGNKDLSIKMSSTIRMAVDIVIASKLPENQTEDFVKEKIKKWREWLWVEWSKEDKDFEPF